MEQTIVVIKPQNEHLIDEILERISKEELRAKIWGKFRFTEERVAEFYSDKTEYEWFGEMVAYLISGISIVLMIRGDKAIDKVMLIKGEIRSGIGIIGTYVVDYTRNVLHCPSSITELNENSQLLKKWLE